MATFYFIGMLFMLACTVWGLHVMWERLGNGPFEGVDFGWILFVFAAICFFAAYLEEIGY